MVDKNTGIWVLAGDVLDAILLMVEEMEKSGIDICCDRSEGAVEISGNDTVYLISWHAPSSQLWVASPRKGSVRFSYDKTLDLWRDEKHGLELLSFVQQEIQEVFGMLGK